MEYQAKIFRYETLGEPLMSRFLRLTFLFALGAMASGALHATPFASNVVLTGTNVSFILNEPADTLTYSINGGPAQALSGAAKGTKTFSLGSPTDTFSISASKYDPVGYTQPTGNTIATSANGLSQPTAEGGFRLISDDTNPLVRFNSPRGVSVSNNPNAPAFGTAYVGNSAAGNTTGVVRAVGDGLYAIHADQSDAFGYGNTAQDPGNQFDGLGASASSPFRTFVAPNGEVYVADFSDTNGEVWRLNSNMTSGNAMFQTVGGTPPLPAGQNHGSTTAVYVEGSSANGDLVVYTLDEDLQSSQFGGPAGDDRNSLWRYNIGSGAVPSNVTPTKVNTTNVLLPAATTDLQRGADGKFYLAQNRAAGAEAGLVVLDASGALLFDSLTASRTLLANPTASDIIRNVLAMAVSEDQKWVALMENNSDVAVVPLVGGIPDLANRLIVNTGTDVNSGRDIAFDAAGNIHYVSSGQALYRVLSPGGLTESVTSWNGSSYSFSYTQTVPEPATVMLVVIGLAAGLLGRARRVA
jgi:hypothetical protein